MTKKEVLRRAQEDLLFFGRAIDPKMFEVASPAFHRELADALIDERLRQLNIIAPRGHAKTSLAGNLLPLYHIVYGPPGAFIVLVSKTRDHATDMLYSIKNTLEYSPHFKALYGYWGKHSAESWQKHSVILKDKTKILCRGANQQLRGLKHINRRVTLSIYDDPEDEENTKTEESRENNLEGLLKGILPGLDARIGRAVVIGTPIHAQGMVNTLEEASKSATSDWVTLKYHALNHADPDVEGGDFAIRSEEQHNYRALWPEMWPVKRLVALHEARKEMGKVSSFYSEYQCEIVGNSEQVFPEENIRYWDGELRRDVNGQHYLRITAKGRTMVDLERPERVPVNLFMGIDPASSTKRTADFSCIFVIAVDKEMNVYCLDYFRRRVKPMDLADRAVAYYTKYRPKQTQVETVGYQEMLRDYLRTHVDEYIPGLEIKNNPRRGKTERLEGLQPDFAMGNVYLRPQMTAFVQELTQFPRSKTFDILDAFYYARKGAYRPFHDVVTEDDIEDLARYREQQARAEEVDWMVV